MSKIDVNSLIPITTKDGELLFDKIKELIPDLDESIKTFIQFIFSEYEIEDYHYIVGTKYGTKIYETDVGSSLFEGIASRIYRNIFPYLKNGKIFNVVTRNDSENSSGNSSANSSGTSNSNHIEEDAPQNEEIDVIDSPTFKNRNIGDFNNNSGKEFSVTNTKTYSSPEYLLQFERIKMYFDDAIRKELQRYIYEFIIVY